MNYRNILFLVLAISILGLVVGLILNNPIPLICSKQDKACLDIAVNQIGETLLLISITTLVISTLLIFVKREKTISSWLKLLAVYIPIELILIFQTPQYCDPLRVCFSRGQVDLIMNSLLLLLGLFLVIRGFLKSRHELPKPY